MRYIGNNYSLGYYLADGIYPNWATFVKFISLPQSQKHQLFAKKQESAKKDVEKAFGVLQSQFAMVRGSSRMWFKKIIGEILRACLIMHNMIVEDERDLYIRQFDFTDDANFSISMPQVSRNHLPEYETYLRSHAIIRNMTHNNQLQADLVEEIWRRFEGEENND
ncbi:uncharacterized protein LOC112505553 [Cynara cardunculus var. scolymus]|uniref:uncharacterized protein LOC112505553 n=1 Tax=Cynara cardunculus var. scolymus TaxID=59895 RepID=UPI000D62AD6A|nr:uncharacterized protein LOC112505553 [Cynara cardunculus var. scolymus]